MSKLTKHLATKIMDTDEFLPEPYAMELLARLLCGDIDNSIIVVMVGFQQKAYESWEKYDMVTTVSSRFNTMKDVWEHDVVVSNKYRDRLLLEML